MSEVSKIQQNETSVQLAKSRHFEVVTVSAPEQMKYALSVSELSKIDKIKTKVKITEIIFKYLSISSKVKNISDFFIEILVEHIVNSCSYLELSEIDYIFKNGILGKLGNNYQEISIDTITGETGWIENYRKNERVKRPEPETLKKINGEYMSNDFEVSENAMSHAEFIKKNPEFDNSKKIQIMQIAKNGNITLDLVNEYFNDTDFVNSKIAEFKSYIQNLKTEYSGLFKLWQIEKNAIKRIDLKRKIDDIEKYLFYPLGKEKTENETILYYFERFILDNQKINKKCPI